MATETLNLEQAAKFLNMTPEGLRRKAASGEIPGARPGKRWVFLKDDLATYLRSLYDKSAKASWGVHKEKSLCHSTKEIKHGGSALATVEEMYNKALGLPTK